MVIDAKPKSLGLPTEAYLMVEEVHDVRYIFCLFYHSNYQLAEAISLSTSDCHVPVS